MRHLAIVAGLVGMAWGVCAGQATQPAWGKPSNGLSVTVETDKAVYAPGEPIKVKVTYRNHTDKPLKLWSPPFPHGMSRFELGSVHVRYLPAVQPSGLVLVVGGKTIQARLPCRQIPPAGVRVQWLTVDPAGTRTRTPNTSELKPGRQQLHAVALGWDLRHHWVGAAVSNRTTIEIPAGFGPRVWAINPRRPSYDAEAVRKKLAKAVGGTWQWPGSGRSRDPISGSVPVPGDGTGMRLRFTIQDAAWPVHNPYRNCISLRRRTIVWLNDECRVVAEEHVNPEVARKIVKAIAGPPPAVALPSADAGLVASGGEDLWPDAPPREGLAGLERLRLEVTATALLNRFSKPGVAGRHIQARLKKDLPKVSLAGTESDWLLRVDLRRQTGDFGGFWETREPWGRMVECRLRVERPCVIDGRRGRYVVFDHSQPVVIDSAIRPGVLPYSKKVGDATEWGLNESLKALVAAWRSANK